jgi:hypothetical protein
MNLVRQPAPGYTKLPVVDMLPNPKQKEFFELALNSAKGQTPYRNLFYGGAIRGGKTYVCLSLLAAFAREFPNSRWHIFRRDFPALESTTIPSFEKILNASSNWKWCRTRSNYHVTYTKNGSKIFFKGENLLHDPELNDLLGLETNGILFEQIEELSPKLWQMGCSRLGSWYIDQMPTPITLATFNPTQRWVKQLIHDPYVQGILEAPHYYMSALPADNSFVTTEQWKAWEHLDERYQLQFIKGDWTDLSDRSKIWAYAFDRRKHLGYPLHDPHDTLYLSFDFNRNPICCSVIQHKDDQIRVLETIKQANSDIYKLCAEIRKSYPFSLCIVTGDATGQHSSALVRDNINYYTVIRQELNLSVNQISVPTTNPSLADNQLLVNSLLARYDICIHEEKAKALIFDLEHVQREADGTIIKLDRRDPTQQADALDTFRYWCNMYMKDHLGRSN